MDILYTCDNNYVWLMGISMISLFENNKDMDKIDVYLLGENISNDNKNTLIKIAEKYKRNCIIIDMPEIEIPESLLSKRWPKSAFNRLYSANILPKNIDKILYLDCDTIICDSLNKLKEKDLNDFFIYGKKDCIGNNYRRNIGLKKDEIYINAGVLVLNYKKLRELNISNIIDHFLKKYENYIHYADQDILNASFNGKIGELPAELNVMTLEYMYSYRDICIMRKPRNYYSQEEISEAINKPTIVHFTTNMLNIRPWYKNSNHPKAKDFLKYKNLSPWKDKKLEIMNTKIKKKDKFFSFLKLLPHKLEIRILGYIHSRIYPNLINLKAKIKQKNKI